MQLIRRRWWPWSQAAAAWVAFEAASDHELDMLAAYRIAWSFWHARGDSPAELPLVQAIHRAAVQAMAAAQAAWLRYRAAEGE